jgi:hypothetical protein
MFIAIDRMEHVDYVPVNTPTKALFMFRSPQMSAGNYLSIVCLANYHAPSKVYTFLSRIHLTFWHLFFSPKKLLSKEDYVQRD